MSPNYHELVAQEAMYGLSAGITPYHVCLTCDHSTPILTISGLLFGLSKVTRYPFIQYYFLPPLQ